MPITLKEALERLEGELNVLQQDGWLSLDALLARLELPKDNEWRRFILGHIPAQYKDWRRFSSSVQRAYQVRLLTEKTVIARAGLPFIATALKNRASFFKPEAEPLKLQLVAPLAKPEQRSFGVRRVAPFGWWIEEFPGGLEESREIKEEQDILKKIRSLRREGYTDYNIVTVLNKERLFYRNGARWLEADINAVLTFDENFRERFELSPPPGGSDTNKKKRSG
jgi:hypothetical protein